jgi:hypothetical protein
MTPGVDRAAHPAGKENAGRTVRRNNDEDDDDDDDGDDVRGNRDESSRHVLCTTACTSGAAAASTSATTTSSDVRDCALDGDVPSTLTERTTTATQEKRGKRETSLRRRRACARHRREPTRSGLSMTKQSLWKVRRSRSTFALPPVTAHWTTEPRSAFVSPSVPSPWPGTCPRCGLAA